MRKRTWKKDDGSAFVELALVLPLLILIVIGSVELGRIAYFAIEVSDAARAGVAYGAQNPTTADPSQFQNIINAAKASAAEVPTLIATPNDACVCETITSSTGAVTTATLPQPCAGSGSMSSSLCANDVTGSTRIVVNYIQVSTTATVSTMFHYPGIPTSFNLSGFAQMRVGQD